MVLSGVRLFICYLPCLWLGMQLGGWTGLALGAAIGNVLAGLAAWRMLKRLLSRPQRTREV
jgi:Na+-driven multidrug efflux pump